MLQEKKSVIGGLSRFAAEIEQMRHKKEAIGRDLSMRSEEGVVEHVENKPRI